MLIKWKQVFLLLFAFLALVCMPFKHLSQESVKPKVLRSVASETVRDKELELAIRDITGESYRSDGVRYRYNRVDLNSDGKPEVIAFLFGTEMCGSGGCDAMVFRRTETGYELITHFEPARNPIIVSTTRTNGWNDLIFENWGGGVSPYFSIARFDGKTYPDNSTVDTSCPPTKKLYKGVAYVVGEYHPEAGFGLPSH